jgi:sialate O-acetylesterase
MILPWLLFSALQAPPTPPPAPAIVFSAGFSSDMVLQRGTGGAAVYGLVVHGDGAAAAPPSVTVRVGQGGGGGAAYTVAAALLPAPTTGIAPFGTAANASAWRALLRPAEAGGPEIAITASCTGCGGGGGGGGTTGTTATLERVAYGDVYFCSGQSNMALPLHYTYSGAPLTVAVLNHGRYASLRLMRYGGMSVSADFQAHAPRYATTVGAADARWWNVTAAAAAAEPSKGGHVALNALHSFSATCLYFGVGLVDEAAAAAAAAVAGGGRGGGGGDDDAAVPIGLVQSAVGGTQIEAWLDNRTLAGCANTSGYNINASTGANDGYGLTSKYWYGMVAPFVNMSVAGWLWCE